MRRKFRVVVNGKEYMVEIEEIGVVQQQTVEPQITQPSTVSPPVAPVKVPEQKSVSEVEGSVTAPMPGKILDIKVSVGNKVKSGDILIILEAMKMENEIVAPRDGEVKEIRVNVGDNVDRGDVLVVIG